MRQDQSPSPVEHRGVGQIDRATGCSGQQNAAGSHGCCARFGSHPLVGIDRHPVTVVCEVAGDVGPMGCASPGAGQVDPVQAAGHARQTYRSRGQQGVLAAIKGRHSRPVGAVNTAVGTLVKPSTAICLGQAHAAGQNSVLIGAGLTQTPLGRSFARHQAERCVVGLGLEHDQRIRATDVNLHAIGRSNQLAQLGRDVGNDLRSAGLAARAVALDAEIMGLHLVAHIGFGNALEREGVATGVAPCQQNCIGLGAFDVGLLCA